MSKPQRSKRRWQGISRSFAHHYGREKKLERLNTQISTLQHKIANNNRRGAEAADRQKYHLLRLTYQL